MPTDVASPQRKGANLTDKQSATLATYRLKLLNSSEKDVKVHEILQRYSRKKNFIVEAIIEHEKSLKRKGTTHSPKPAPTDPALGAVLDKLSTIECMIKKMDERLDSQVSLARDGEDMANFKGRGKPQAPMNGNEGSGLNDEDLENFQRAQQAFGALNDMEDD